MPTFRGIWKSTGKSSLFKRLTNSKRKQLDKARQRATAPWYGLHVAELETLDKRRTYQTGAPDTITAHNLPGP